MLTYMRNAIFIDFYCSTVCFGFVDVARVCFFSVIRFHGMHWRGIWCCVWLWIVDTFRIFRFSSFSLSKKEKKLSYARYGSFLIVAICEHIIIAYNSSALRL